MVIFNADELNQYQGHYKQGGPAWILEFFLFSCTTFHRDRDSRYNNYWNIWVMEITPRYPVFLFPQWHHSKASIFIFTQAPLAYIQLDSVHWIEKNLLHFALNPLIIYITPPISRVTIFFTIRILVTLLPKPLKYKDLFWKFVKC